MRQLLAAEPTSATSERVRSWQQIGLRVIHWGLAVLTDQHRRDLLEILDDRYNMRATIITSQLPIAH